MKKAILIVLDSVGIGAAPDAMLYQDEHTHTLGHIIAHYREQQQPFTLPYLASLGLGRILGVEGSAAAEPQAGSFYGRLTEASRGKDTVTGHWEMTGIVTKTPFPVYPQGFPPEMVEAFEQAAGTKILGNEPASGTEIIERLGEAHLASGYPIVYTSADSVWQIAAHEAVIPLETLYRYCEIARELFKAPPHNIGRIIARPFIGELGSFTRTANRRDYALPPDKHNLLCDLAAAGQTVTAIGKISDIFADTCISTSVHTVSNDDGMHKLLELYPQTQNGLLFLNLVDFDAKYGHRRDPYGYGQALLAFDKQLGQLLSILDEETLLVITADHGCDPTAHGTDHTREYVPLLLYQRGCAEHGALAEAHGFGHIGATIADYLAVPYSGQGQSLLPLAILTRREEEDHADL